jgi:hypothetical protein
MAAAAAGYYAYMVYAAPCALEAEASASGAEVEAHKKREAIMEVGPSRRVSSASDDPVEQLKAHMASLQVRLAFGMLSTGVELHIAGCLINYRACNAGEPVHPTFQRHMCLCVF